MRPIFKKIRHDSITPNLLDKGISRILTPYYRTSLNKTGVHQLKESTSRDSLSIQIIEIYDLMDNTFILPNEKRLAEEGTKRTDKMKKYAWYSEWQSKTIMQDNSSKELQDYFLYSMEYKNDIFYQYQLLYNNYHVGIARSLSSLENIKDQIQKKLTYK
jgi:hypothetical protein